MEPASLLINRLHAWNTRLSGAQLDKSTTLLCSLHPSAFCIGLYKYKYIHTYVCMYLIKQGKTINVHISKKKIKNKKKFSAKFNLSLYSPKRERTHPVNPSHRTNFFSSFLLTDILRLVNLMLFLCLRTYKFGDRYLIGEIIILLPSSPILSWDVPRLPSAPANPPFPQKSPQRKYVFFFSKRKKKKIMMPGEGGKGGGGRSVGSSVVYTLPI